MSEFKYPSLDELRDSFKKAENPTAKEILKSLGKKPRLQGLERERVFEIYNKKL